MFFLIHKLTELIEFAFIIFRALNLISNEDINIVCPPMDTNQNYQMISNTQLLIHNIATMSQLLIDNLTKLRCGNKSISDFSRCHNATVYIATMKVRSSDYVSVKQLSRIMFSQAFVLCLLMHAVAVLFL